VAVIQVRPGDVCRDGVGVGLHGTGLGSRGGGDVAVLPGLPDAVEVERVRTLPVGVVEGDLHPGALGRADDRPGHVGSPPSAANAHACGSSTGPIATRSSLLAEAAGLAKSTTSEKLHRAEGAALTAFVGSDTDAGLT